jgi:murein DD-endopeptidase MepM/ murein hydrolase activator NlpD
MKLLYLIFLPAFGFGQDSAGFVTAANEKIKADTTFVYSLPWEAGKSHFVIQGYNSKLSHRDELALDIKMRRGTKVCAMRNGVVEEIKSDSRRRGLKPKYFADGNYILIRHPDNSFGWYFHLKYDGVFIRVGDSVAQGQLIGLSGNSGYSAFPHLHIEVVVHKNGRYVQIPTRFQSKTGVQYLKPGRFYRRPKN